MDRRLRLDVSDDEAMLILKYFVRRDFIIAKLAEKALGVCQD
tara:strand:+ start:735 stop:860 length:126 start_codon:yes stop_codon:yes gene_type:complete